MTSAQTPTLTANNAPDASERDTWDALLETPESVEFLREASTEARTMLSLLDEDESDELSEF